ncbi:hypothetical protein [Candidatus Symbiopectobacterium sp.]|nr:hypothetical protein [Candidatus Symbiopectobacterium sp.]
MVICSDDYPKVLFIQQSHADGELIGRTPAHFTIEQKTIEVFAPR